MKRALCIGVLAYHGDVQEHIDATISAARKLHREIIIIPVRTKQDMVGLDGLIIPGGESTTLYKLSQKEGIFSQMKKIKYIFGTCAGAIMLAKNVKNKTPDQKTLALMNITVDRNAYGRQTDSFEQDITSSLGKLHAVFIRAPRILAIEKNVTPLARIGKEIIACEESIDGKYYLASCFHPELSSTLFHEYFLTKIY